ncbi:cation-translocating P-type ATPase [Spiroplasma endosymbiont of Labia minor]|uniref:cation-translocating P-type ATPase n=1 Tax=Spiroplasma endosymbiont of Labia minor TaxID=3066305 RepID=UPI0030D4AAAA
MNDYLMKSDSEIEIEYKTDLNNGLSENEAKIRLEQNGKNELPKAKQKSWALIFLLALVKPIQLILIVAAVISVIFPMINNGWKVDLTEFIDFIVIMAIVIIDAILETVQTMKAHKSMEALKSLSKPITVVLREGQQKEIDASELVIGDVIVLEAGKYIPAELRLIDAQDLSIDESILTGESVPVEKTDEPLLKQTIILAEMTNIAFMGTFITAGRATGIVIKTAKESEIGKIAVNLSANDNHVTPLEKKLNRFSFWISGLSFVIAALIFLSLFFVGQKTMWVDYLMVAITLAIGVIPESLSAVVSITLSFSTKRMASQNVIVKQLAAVETLGSVNVICTDKTGTLTQNKMTVVKVIVDNKIVASQDFIKEGTDEHKDLFLKALVLPNDSVTEGKERIGDPTELALVDYADLMGYDEQKSRKKWERIDEIPFDSERKLMTSVNKIDGVLHTFTKGAIDQILTSCDEILIDNKIRKITPQIIKDLQAKADELSNQALRVLAFAYNTDYDDEPDKDDIEKNLIFIGAVAMIDPVRETAVEAVKEAHKAGIKVVMITGDHATTALAIAKDLDLAYTEYEVISSDRLATMSDEDLRRIVDQITVYARVNPEHKVRIVDALQSQNKIVSMTGDGVNDAPSLAKADVGVAMGITGTDVAKEAANVILTDDNFLTIMKGVNEGRNVYQKIKRAVTFVMGVNLSNVLSIFLISVFVRMSPLEATNILWMNLIVESVLAIAIGMGPNDKTLMTSKPKPRSAKLFEGLWLSLFKIIVFNTIAGIGAYFIGQLFYFSLPQISDIFDRYGYNHNYSAWLEILKNPATSIDEKQIVTVLGRTCMFIVITCAPCGFVNFIKLTNWKNSKKINWLINKPLVYASLGAFILNFLVVFIPTVNNEIFKLTSINDWNKNNAWLILISIAIILWPNLTILLSDAMIFLSYHYFPKSWERNRSIVSKMVANDRKIDEMIKKKRKNKNN